MFGSNSKSEIRRDLNVFLFVEIKIHFSDAALYLFLLHHIGDENSSNFLILNSFIVPDSLKNYSCISYNITQLNSGCCKKHSEKVRINLEKKVFDLTISFASYL